MSHRQVFRSTAAATVALTVLGGSLATGPAAWAATPSLATFQQQKVAWAPCDVPAPPGAPADEWRALWAGVECGDVLVPLNYKRPGDGNLRIAASRLRAKDPNKRQGVLLLNPGGPGGDGRVMPGFLRTNAVAESFDLIGFDPRGVPASSQLDCGVSPEPVFDTRPTDAQFPALAEQARLSELACQRTGGGIRPYISTANTARDMDVIRAVLGEKKINYLGFSYGTHLGAVYGSLFPRNLNRSVLDSSMHPDWFYYEATKQQAVAARQSVDAWAGWVAERNGTYQLGASAAEVVNTLETLRAKLAAKPVPLPGGPAGFPAVDGRLFDILVGSIATPRPGWAMLAELVGELRKAATVTLSTDAEKALKLLVPWAIEETVNGVFQTVTCEADWPTDVNVYNEQMRLFRQKYPYGPGAMAAAPTGCAFRSFTPQEKLVNLKRAGYPVGLVVQAEADPATQYDGGPAMASRLDHNLVSVVDEGSHGMYGSNTCATKKIDDYLVHGILPGSRTVCPGAPRPAVPADGQAGNDPRTLRAATSLEATAKTLVESRRPGRVF